MKIHFGTDGWRGVLADDFTFRNVGRVAQAVANYLKSERRKKLTIYTEWGVPYRPPSRGLIVGYDTRFMSESFARHFAKVIHQNDIPVKVSTSPITSPALSYGVEWMETAGGVMVTASHNPPQYNGIKFKPEFASSAPPEVTESIENFLSSHYENPTTPTSKLETVDLKTPHLERIKEIVDLDILSKAPLKVVIDPMYGAARDCVAQVLKELEVPFIQIRDRDNPYFGGKSPEPLDKNLTPSKAVLASWKKRLSKKDILIGVATDGDGDRVAGITGNGEFIDSHRFYSLILRHLVEERDWTGEVVKSFPLTDMAVKLAQKNNLPLKEVPVGFKYICELFVKEDVLIGGEESGGIGIKNYIPERDGVLMSLLLLEITATKRKPIGVIIKDMMKEIGYHYYNRRDLHLAKRKEVVARLKEKPPRKFAGKEVIKVEDLDGVKLRFEDGWLLFRGSGTEPVLRLYSEMDTKEKVANVLNQAEKFARR